MKKHWFILILALAVIVSCAVGTRTEETRNSETKAITSNAIVLSEKVIDIGPWDMDNVSVIDVPHGLGEYYKNIRMVSVMVRDDYAYDWWNLETVQDQRRGYTMKCGGFMWANNVNLCIVRGDGLRFDSAGFKSTAFNRGKITIWYEE